MRYLICLLPLLLVLVSCDIQSRPNERKMDYPHYDMRVKLNPETGEMGVTGTLTVPNPVSDTFTFYLARTMKVQTFTTNRGHDIHIDRSPSDVRFMPEAMRISLRADQHAMPGETLIVTFAYSGILPELPRYFGNAVGKEWSEIGMYYPWYPLEWERMRLYTYHVEVDSDSRSACFGLGKTLSEDHGQVLVSDSPANDIVIFAAPDVKQYSAGAVTVYHHGLSNETLERMGQDLNHILTLEQSWFGGVVGHVSIVISGRKTGGGYARIGGVVLGGLDEHDYVSKNAGYQRYFGHELGHLWWFKARTDTWEDWLNESFAEYTALMVLRETFGDADYAQRLKEKRESSRGTAPIWGFDRNGADWQDVQKVLYDKGPVLLAELELRLGQSAFRRFCRELLVHNVTETEDLLQLLGQQAGDDTADWFRQQLKTR